MSLPGASSRSRPVRGRRPARPANYTPIAKRLHWLTVVLLVVQYLLAWTMPGIQSTAPPQTLTNLHMSFGAVILIVTLIRLFWRIAYPVPAAPESSAFWKKCAALLVHYGFYALLLAQPLLGWAWASARGWPVRIFGLPPLPPLVGGNSPWRGTFASLHTTIATALLVLVAIHTLAALHHHFVLRDNVLRRMLPGRV